MEYPRIAGLRNQIIKKIEMLQLEWKSYSVQTKTSNPTFTSGTKDLYSYEFKITSIHCSFQMEIELPQITKSVNIN